MKIIHIILGKANPNTMNGVNVVVHNLATAQLEQNIDVEVWGITKTPQNKRHKHKYELRLFQKNKFGFFIDQSLKEKIKAVPRHTLFHLHSAFIPELFSVVKLLKRFDIPYILTPHGAFNQTTMNNKKIKKYLYFNFFEKKILENAKLIHFIDKNEQEHVRELGITTSSILIPNGAEKIDLQLLEYKKNIKTIVFSYCGRISIYTKGLDLLVKAFINYKTHGGKGILQFIGDGAELSALIDQVKLSDFKDDIHFLGKMFGKEKLDILYSSDVFVHTSRHDGMPMAILEASELAIPLLISKETNLGSFVSKYKAGKVLTTNTIENIEKSLFEMEDLFNRGELKQYGIQAKKMIDQELNWNTIAKTFIYNYKKIIDQI